MLKWVLLLGACRLAASNAIRFGYLPPVPEMNVTAMEDELAGRIGEFDQLDSDIRFETEGGPSTLFQREVDRIISRGVTQLGLQLESALSPSQGRGIFTPASEIDNLVFSPLSVATALAMVMLGAGGQTFLEVARVLGLDTGVHLADRSNVVHEEFGRLLAGFKKQPGVAAPTETVSAGAIFVQEGYPIRQRFRKISREAYGSDVLSLDFKGHGEESRNAINHWIEDKTRGRIMNFITEPPSPNTRVIIASALYFNGAWENPFPKEYTTKRPFYVSDSEVLDVPMMALSAELPYLTSDVLGCRVLGLPYKGGEVTMYLVLPNKPGVAALRDLQEKLTVPIVEEMVSSLKEQSVIALLPRMKLEASFSLKDALRAMGVSSLFDPRLADLSLLSPGELKDSPVVFQPRTGNSNSTAKNEVQNSSSGHGMVFRDRRAVQGQNPGLYADDVLHKVEVEVTETGTVASAVTVVSISRDGSRATFRVDRPFLFFIRHQSSGLVLFWGSVVRPTPSTPKAPTKTG